MELQLLVCPFKQNEELKTKFQQLGNQIDDF